MGESKFTQADHLAWCRFMYHTVVAMCFEFAARHGDGREEFVEMLRARLAIMWQGLGAQGVEGATLSVRLTLEALGSAVLSSQVSPEMAELVVDEMPGEAVMNGLQDRFDIQMDRSDWLTALSIGPDAVHGSFDILNAIADAAGVEYFREATDDGNVRLVLRAW